MNTLTVLKNQHKPEHKLFLCVSILVLERAYEVEEYYTDDKLGYNDNDISISLIKGNNLVHLALNHSSSSIEISSCEADEVVDCYNVLSEHFDILHEEEKDIIDIELGEEEKPCVSEVELKRRNVVWSIIKLVKSQLTTKH